MRKQVTVLSILKGKTDKELLYLFTVIFGLLFFLVMDIEHIFSLWNLLLFLIIGFISFKANRMLRQYLRRS